MKITAGVISELHDVIRKKIREISNGDDAEAAGMAKRWFDLVEDTNFEGINFNEDIYEKLVSSKSVPADMSYFTFRNHFLTKVIEPVRAAVLEFLTDKDSSLKRDRDELDWISGFLDNYVTVASTNRVVAELRKEYVNNKAELNAAHKLADKVFEMENGTMNKLAKRIEKIARSLIAVDESIGINSFEGLKRAFEAIDDNGEYGKSGFWTIALGGYDTGYVVSYKGREIFRVNYEFGEYEVYDKHLDDESIQMMKRILKCTNFEEYIG